LVVKRARAARRRMIEGQEEPRSELPEPTPEPEAAPEEPPAPKPKHEPAAAQVIPFPAPAPAPAPPEALPVPVPARKRRAVTARARGLSGTGWGGVSKIGELFAGRKELAPATVDEVEKVLLTADIGVRTSQKLMEEIRSSLSRKDLKDPEAVWEFL